MARVFFFLLAALFTPLATASADLARGWGDAIAWKTLPDGLAAAATSNKPVLLLIWKSWCGACKALRPLFAASADVAALAGSFEMVNTVDDEEPKDAVYAPDGGYIPRILFLAPNGTVIKGASTGNAQYAYFHSSPGTVAATMRAVAADVAARAVDAAPAAPDVSDL
jgi:protein-disulfide reductase (glutathione)